MRCEERGGKDCLCLLVRMEYVRFASCVGQFVLAASLRAQANPANRSEFKQVSPERFVYFTLLYYTHAHTLSLCFFRIVTVLLTSSLQSFRGLCAGLHRTALLRLQFPRMRIYTHLPFPPSFSLLPLSPSPFIDDTTRKSHTVENLFRQTDRQMDERTDCVRV